MRFSSCKRCSGVPIVAFVSSKHCRRISHTGSVHAGSLDCGIKGSAAPSVSRARERGSSRMGGELEIPHTLKPFSISRRPEGVIIVLPSSLKPARTDARHSGLPPTKSSARDEAVTSLYPCMSRIASTGDDDETAA